MAGSGGAVLTVEELHTAYGLSRVLFGVSLHIGAGECVCLLGRNGVGKTTTMRSIMGLTPAASGRIVWKGRNITRQAPFRVAELGIGFVPEDRRIFADLTVWENLDVATRRRGADGFTVERVFELFPKLRELRDRQGGFLSGGEQQMLTIARTLMGNPELLLLDEPSEGLAPLVVEHLRQQIARLKAGGQTILLAEQNVEFSLSLADRVYVLEKGHIRYEGTAREFREDETIRQRYLAL
ncbi:MAG: ABC transporter ATP-binding protein [Candidatus Rokuibacteriota bacterium]|nr:MAG: ABC transporter ATP-binding protein [Candidatus Rokubacteria bacterium]